MNSQPTKLEELNEITISDLYNEGYGGHPVVYEIPIYQRNYAWGKEEISTLIQDVYHAFSSDKKKNYYIGTLVSFCRGDQNGVRTYEVIDGQQRLTTIFLILNSLGVKCTNRLTYKARRKANNAIDSLMNGQPINSNDLDKGIKNGLDDVKESLDEIVPSGKLGEFANYFQQKVHIIHYQVPQDIDLNHYFEIMNSRGEQLEMSEVLKARLMEKLNEADKAKFSLLWECCSEMNVYVRQKYAEIFEIKAGQPIFALSFDNLFPKSTSLNIDNNKPTINLILGGNEGPKAVQDDGGNDDSFQPIMDFANFLLIVLKLTVKLEESDLDAKTIVLADNELLNQFDYILNQFDYIPNPDNQIFKENFVKKFGYNLLKARFFLDNYIVHHSCEEDTAASNPWKLQCWRKDGQPELSEDEEQQEQQDVLKKELIHLLSMFEVSYTSRQGKNYLFYCLLYLFENNYKDENDYKDLEKFRDFLSKLADKYFWDIYYMAENHNSFDEVILPLSNLYSDNKKRDEESNTDIFGGTTRIPLFIFNYLDYKIWKKYSDLLLAKNDPNVFFPNEFGCTADPGLILKSFKQFYFSRTRRSLEHYYPQANVNEEMTEKQINCFGNLAMIGGEVNSSGSNWSPKTKLEHYLDPSGKIPRVSVASLKFLIMMQMCRDNHGDWNYESIKTHQDKMLNILLYRKSPEQPAGNENSIEKSGLQS